MSLPVQIDTLKSTIGRRGGMARPNRFAVYISHPSSKQGLINTDLTSLVSNIGTSMLSGGSVDPMMFFNDPRDMFLLCESAQLPGKRVTTTESMTDIKAQKRPYSYLMDDVTMTFLLTNDYYTRKYFDSWQDSIVSFNNKKISYKKEYASDISIQQIGVSNDIIPAYNVKLKNAYPIALAAVELSNANENSLIQCTVTFTFDDWEQTGLIDGFSDLIDAGSNLITNTGTQINNIINNPGSLLKF